MHRVIPVNNKKRNREGGIRMKPGKKIRIMACIALIFVFSFPTCIYAQKVEKGKFGQIEAFGGLIRAADAPEDGAADGLIDLFTVLTGYSAERKPKEETVKESASYIFPPLVRIKTLMLRLMDHPQLTLSKEVPIARLFFTNALFGAANIRPNSRMGQQLWDALRTEPEFTETVKEAMEGQDKATFLYRAKSKDLSYSVAHIVCKCRRMASKENGEEILVECSDYYDFLPSSQTVLSGDTFAILNEIGWQLYRLRILNPYSIYAMGTITFP